MRKKVWKERGPKAHSKNPDFGWSAASGSLRDGVLSKSEDV